MSNTIANAVQTLTNKIVNGTLTPQENAQLGVAINQLTSGANVEAALVAVAEQHLNTATGSLGQSTAALNSAKEAFAAQATEELSKIPGLISSINNATQKTYNFSQTPVHAIMTLSNSHGHFVRASDRAPANKVSIEDFDTKETYFYFDRGASSTYTDGSYNGVYCRLGKIDANGTVSVVSRRVALTGNNQSYGMVPFYDNSVRLFSTNTNVGYMAATTITILKANGWDTETSIAVDFSVLKVRNSDRALIYVKDGKAMILDSAGVKNTGVAIANASAFNAEFSPQKGYSTVTMYPYYSSSNNAMTVKNTASNQDLMTPPNFDVTNQQFEFSKALGLISTGHTNLKVDIHGDSWMLPYNATNHQYSGFTRYVGTGLIGKTAHADEKHINVALSYRRGDTHTQMNQSSCYVMAISRQNNKMIYISSSSIETTEGIAQAI